MHKLMGTYLHRGKPVNLLHQSHTVKHLLLILMDSNGPPLDSGKLLLHSQMLVYMSQSTSIVSLP